MATSPAPTAPAVEPEVDETDELGLPPEAPAPVVEYETTINGKAVALRRRVPLKIGHALPRMLVAASQSDGDLASLVPVMTLLVESWGFDGDPTDAASYDELDTIDEAMPLAKFVGEHIHARSQQSPKA